MATNNITTNKMKHRTSRTYKFAGKRNDFIEFGLPILCR